jgi:hypothetical protein
MVSLRNPDLARFPRFAQALAASQSAELGPGDALFIPFGWWHHVESLTPFNVLVNYWWNDARRAGSAFDAMLHAVLALRDLPPEQRAVCLEFEHYVFQPAETPGAPAGSARRPDGSTAARSASCCSSRTCNAT